MLRSKLQQMMYGRNGADALSTVALWLSVALWVVFLFSGWPFVYALSIVLIFYSLFRVFSRQTDKRRSENARFLTLARPMARRVSTFRARLHDKDHRYFHCPNCKQQMRVPRGKGRIQVTCRNCGITFEEKS